MSVLAVVKTFNVIEHISTRLVSGPVLTPFDAFALESGEEALHHRIVVTATRTTQAAVNAMLFQ